MSSVVTAPEVSLQQAWRRDGYVVLPRVVPADVIDRLNEDVAAFRRSCGESKDECGLGQRIGLFHVRNPHAMVIALNPEVRRFLSWALEDEPLLYGSLTFEAGTEQAAHQDSIFFYTQPLHAMAGCWTALEDIDPEAGPLFYYPGSHTWPLDGGAEILARHPDLRRRRAALAWSFGRRHKLAELAAEMGNRWHGMLAERIAASGTQAAPALIRKGDVLVWHALLVHGGMRRKVRSLSRRSIVAHFIGKHARMFDMTSFFTLRPDQFDERHAFRMKVRDTPGGGYVTHEEVVTY